MNRERIEKNIILKLTFNFSLSVIEYCDLLESQRRYVIAKQLLRAATSVGANAMEAQHAESRADFIHKFRIAAKEGEETEYWLLLCNHPANFPDCTQLLTSISEINKIIGKIIKSKPKIRQSSNFENQINVE